jgi:hypothetical protein
MPEHDCIQQKEIGRISAILDKISKEVYGNHEAGLVKTIPRLEEKINNLAGSVASHTNVISSFIEFQATHNGEVRSKKEMEERAKIAIDLLATQKRDKMQKIFMSIMAIIAACGLTLTAYFGFINNKKQDTAIKKVEGLGEPVVTNSRGSIYPLPPDVKVRYFRNDSVYNFRDTVR